MEPYFQQAEMRSANCQNAPSQWQSYNNQPSWRGQGYGGGRSRRKSSCGRGKGENIGNKNNKLWCRLCKGRGHTVRFCKTHEFVPRRKKIEVANDPTIWSQCKACGEYSGHYEENCPSFMIVRKQNAG